MLQDPLLICHGGMRKKEEKGNKNKVVFLSFLFYPLHGYIPSSSISGWPIHATRDRIPRRTHFYSSRDPSWYRIRQLLSLGAYTIAKVNEVSLQKSKHAIKNSECFDIRPISPRQDLENMANPRPVPNRRLPCNWIKLSWLPGMFLFCSNPKCRFFHLSLSLSLLFRPRGKRESVEEGNATVFLGGFREWAYY